MQVCNVLTKGGLIVFGDEEVIGTLVFHQKACRFLLGVEGISGDDGAF